MSWYGLRRLPAISLAKRFCSNLLIHFLTIYTYLICVTQKADEMAIAKLRYIDYCVNVTNSRLELKIQAALVIRGGYVLKKSREYQNRR
jgi:hypothetical protein